MRDLYREWESAIREYCQANGLDFSKAQEAGKCWNDDFLMLQHVDPQKGQHGLLHETPAPVILIVRKNGDDLIFEKTEYTQKYLAL